MGGSMSSRMPEIKKVWMFPDYWLSGFLAFKRSCIPDLWFAGYLAFKNSRTAISFKKLWRLKGSCDTLTQKH
jgi:hypothetical protein